MDGHDRTTAELDEIRRLAAPLRDPGDLDPLLDRAGDARIVMIGEASHGTADYYRWRAELTRRLITERDFSFVAVEGDWPDCFEVNRWLKGRADGRSAREVLGTFRRWPTWMWANDEVADFLTWLRAHDDAATDGDEVGFYGLDVYSLWESLRRIVEYLDDAAPEAVAAAVAAARCFDPYGGDPQRYAWATRMVPDTCEDEVVDLLTEMHRSPPTVADDEPESGFDATQNAEVLAGAERYYRIMVRGDGESWNVRDRHMADTLDRLLDHHGDGARAVVWEHNTHVGDARATDMAAAGMLNLGQVARERHGTDDVVLVGLAGHRGSVVAGRSWGAPAEAMTVPEARSDTHEDLLHRAVGEPALIVFPEDRDGPWLTARRGHRAIGVVYRPEHDHVGNWVPTVMGRRYDALCSLERTEALHPLPVPPDDDERATEPWGT